MPDVEIVDVTELWDSLVFILVGRGSLRRKRQQHVSGVPLNPVCCLVNSFLFLSGIIFVRN